MQPDGYFNTFYPACPFRSHFCELSFMKMKIFLSRCCHCKGTPEGALSHPGANECFGSSRHPGGDFHDRDYSTQVQWISVKSMKLGGWSWLAWRSRGRDRAEIDEHALDLASRSPRSDLSILIAVLHIFSCQNRAVSSTSEKPHHERQQPNCHLHLASLF